MKLPSLITKHKAITIILILIVAGGGYYFYHRAKNSTQATTYLTESAQKTTIVASVAGTGQVLPLNKLDIKPQGSGIVTATRVRQGDQVKSGDVLVVLDEQNNLSALRQARANLESAQANYQKVLAGATAQDIAVSQASVDAAQGSLDNAKTAYNNTVAQQKLAVSNAYANYLNSNLTAQAIHSYDSTLTLTVSGAYSGTQTGSYNISLQDSGTGGYFYSITGLENYSGTVVRGVPLPAGSNGLYITFGTTGNLSAVDSWVINVPNTQGSSYLSNYNAYQTALQNQTVAISNAQTAISSAQTQLQQAQAALALKQAPPATADVAQAQAQVDAAQSQLQTAQTNYDNNIITAPFTGQVAVLNVQNGDQVSAGTAVATLITQEKIAQISLNEVDAAQVKVGQKATLTFDAIDGLSIAGQVVEVDTLGTVSQGVVTYNVKVAFDNQNNQVKPDMSTNVSIITNLKADVIAVPSAAVKSGAAGNYVQMLDSTGKPQNRPVQIGITDGTMTEITSGVNEGDSVVTQTVASSQSGSAAAQRSNSSSGGAIRIPGLGGGRFGG